MEIETLEEQLVENGGSSLLSHVLDPTRTPHLTPVRGPAVITYYNPLGKIVEHYEAELAKSQTLCDELKRRSEESGEEKIKVWARFSRTLRMSKSFFKIASD